MIPTRKCAKGQLIARDESEGFVNLGFDLGNEKYLITTVCPNWQGRMPEYGQIGLIEYEEAIAGITEYFENKHKYTAAYFITFLPIVENVKAPEVYKM